MPATYNQPTKEEFDELLSVKGWQCQTMNRTGEYKYVFPLSSSPHIEIQVYSSVSSKDDAGRGCGKDAIRVCAVDTLANRGYIKSGRVNRTTNWKDNLKAKIELVFTQAQERRNRELNKR